MNISKRWTAIRSVTEPLELLPNGDVLLADDITAFGMRRIVIARKYAPPNAEEYLARAAKQASAWCVPKEDGYWYLWIVWKEKTDANGDQNPADHDGNRHADDLLA
jgi:hypothetical protein